MVQKPAASQPASSGRAILTLFYQTAYGRYANNPLMLANLQSGTPSFSGLSRLPGATDLDKVNYALDYFAAGASFGASVGDMVAHDVDLVKARPIINGVRVTNPAKAAAIYFGGGGNLHLIQGNLDREIENDPNWTFEKAPQYANFWKRYGLPA
jgi:hypothetical protein